MSVLSSELEFRKTVSESDSRSMQFADGWAYRVIIIQNNQTNIIATKRSLLLTHAYLNCF